MMENTNMQIYKTIVTIVLDPDFSENTQTFMNGCYKQFSEDEENKLEYTQIHNDYVKILDQIIDS